MKRIATTAFTLCGGSPANPGGAKARSGSDPGCQVFYQVNVRRIVEKSEAGYNAVQTDLVQMRRAGALAYSWLADNTRFERKPRTFNSVAEALHDTARPYRKALWANADAYFEIWLEKDALAGVVMPVTALYDARS